MNGINFAHTHTHTHNILPERGWPVCLARSPKKTSKDLFTKTYPLRKIQTGQTLKVVVGSGRSMQTEQLKLGIRKTKTLQSQQRQRLTFLPLLRHLFHSPFMTLWEILTLLHGQGQSGGQHGMAAKPLMKQLFHYLCLPQHQRPEILIFVPMLQGVGSNVRGWF